MEGCPEDLKYEEKNNKSYKKHKEFANEAVAKMEAIKVVKKVDKQQCRFISPLTVAVNKVGKKRLCIDLSRGFAPLHKQTCLRGKYIFVIDWIYICFYFHKVENWIFLGEKMNTSLL